MMKLTNAIKFSALAALLQLGATCVIAAPEFVVASPDHFAHPHDLELDPTGRWVFIADVNHHDVKVLDAHTLSLVAVIGDGELNSPHDVHFDVNGHLLVADSGNDRIVIYQLNGTNAKSTGVLADGLRSPEGVTSDDKGNIYVASTGNHKILNFRDNKLIKSVGDRGEGKLQFIRPHDIERGSDGLLYVGDPGNRRIQVLTDSLTYYATIEDRKRPFAEPKYLALDGDWLFVADQQNNMLRIFDGQRKEKVSIREAGGKDLNYIEGVEARNGKIWISDTYNNRIVLFRWLPD